MNGSASLYGSGERPPPRAAAPVGGGLVRAWPPPHSALAALVGRRLGRRRGACALAATAAFGGGASSPHRGVSAVGGDRLGRGCAAVLATCALATLRASLTARRLVGPRTGARSMNTQPDVRHRLAADEPALLEEPRVLAVELLERVVRQDGGAGPAGDLQDEGVAATDRPGRRRDQLVGVDGVLVGLAFLAVDAVGERGVDDHGHVLGRVLLDERLHRLVELGEARERPALGGDVRSVDDDVGDRHVLVHSTKRTGRSEGRLPLRCRAVTDLVRRGHRPAATPHPNAASTTAAVVG